MIDGRARAVQDVEEQRFELLFVVVHSFKVERLESCKSKRVFGVVKEIADVRVTTDLTVTLTPSADATVPVTLLCGVEVVAEGW